jgi:hypothetical protein
MKLLPVFLAVLAMSGATTVGQERSEAMPDIRLMTLDPGHFHAALIQRHDAGHRVEPSTARPACAPTRTAVSRPLREDFLLA